MNLIRIDNKYEFEQFYLHYFPRLVRFAQVYVLSDVEAENMVQDVFLALWEQKDTLQHINNMPAFLFRLTKNKCIDFLRHKIMCDERNRLLHETQMREDECRLRSMMQFDDSSFDNEELYDAMHQAIRALPEKCRDIFLLSRFEGLSHHEIATRLGISTSTVNNQISLAMKKLKERLRP